MTDTSTSCQNEAGTSAARRVSLATEFLAIFFGIPMLHVLGVWPWHPMSLLGIVGICAVTWLFIGGNASRQDLLGAPDLRLNLKRILVLFIPVAFIMTAAAVSFLPAARQFALPHNHPWLYLVILLAYPPLSVYPQELVYRCFVFRRYAPLFRDTTTMILASAIAFSFAHIVFDNWLAPLLCLPAGVVFGFRYARTRSLMIVTIEHTLYGILIFTVGLGTYFHHGFTWH